MPFKMTRTNLAFAFAGLIVGGLFVWVLLVGFPRGSEDEERPPIIVKGGSLIIQSGDPESSDPTEKNGKPWIKYNGDWQPDHPNGNKTKWFSIALLGGSPGACPGLSQTKEMTITYRAKDGTETTFTLSLKGRSGSGSPAPAISEALTAGGTTANPQLHFGNAGEGSIARIEFIGHATGPVNCTGPSGAKIWQFR